MLKIPQLTGPGNTIEVVYQPNEEEIQSNPNIFLEPPFTQEDIRLLQSIPEVEQVVTASSEFSGNDAFGKIRWKRPLPA